MLASRLPGIMAPLLPEEAVEATRLHSLAGALNDGGAHGGSQSGPLVSHPPFRRPHHTASAEGLLGGGKCVRPGEISLAHNGVLFLDEAPEFHTNVLQALREPLEERHITISRAEGQIRLPADFQLILAANPCPCGRLGKGECVCSGLKITNYWKRFGGALLDRVELRVPVAAPDTEAMGGEHGEPSGLIRERVLRAVDIQRERFRNYHINGRPCRRNAAMDSPAIDRWCALDDRAKTALETAVTKLDLSGRAYHAILRSARTIADLEGKDAIGAEHLLEAVTHRRYGDDPYDVLSA
jgi:magnesium chelatase family protein